ncbi:MAG: gamma-glutamyltransferase [Bryobacterales bacterium]
MSADHRFSHDRMAFRDARRGDPSLWSATSANGMVATAHYLATAAGVEMLEAGGNAIDAAVAASLALGVCEPAGSGLGGMTVALIHIARSGRTFVLGGACRAPRRATPEGLRGRSRYRGRHAAAVPTNAAFLQRAVSDYGALDRQTVIAPAIRIAEQGFPLTTVQHKMIGVYRRPLRNCGGGRLFLDASDRPLPAGSWMRQEALARTLRRLATAGFEDFYHGEIARSIADDMERNGGFLRQDDLREYSEVAESTPLEGNFGLLRAATLGPPGGGAALLQMLEACEPAAGDFDPDSPAGIVLLAESIRQARLARRWKPFRAARDASHPRLSPADDGYATAVTGENCPAPPEDPSAGLDGGGETSHVTIADREGNWVSLTQSLERSFGSAAFDSGLGFLYNGYMRTFKLRTTRHPHFLRPGAPARSNAAPMLLFQDGEPWAAIGNTGSERLASGILQVLLRLRRQTPFQSVLAPRLHCTPEGLVLLEADRFPAGSVDALAAQGYQIQRLDAFSFKVGGLQLIVRQGESLCGVAEPRRDGAAGGPGAISG